MPKLPGNRFSRTELARRKNRFIDSLYRKPPATAREFNERARRLGLNIQGLRDVRERTNLSFKKSRAAPAKVPKVLADKVSDVFVQWDNYLHKLAMKYVRQGVPFEVIRDGLFDHALKNALRFDPRRKIKFSTWIIGGWKENISGVVRKYWNSPESTEAKVGGRFLRAVISRERTPLEGLLAREERERLNAALKGLEGMERRVIEVRFGLGGGKPLTLKETGAKLRIS